MCTIRFELCRETPPVAREKRVFVQAEQADEGGSLRGNATELKIKDWSLHRSLPCARGAAPRGGENPH